MERDIDRSGGGRPTRAGLTHDRGRAVAISQEQTGRVVDWLQANVKNGCPLCESTDWEVQDIGAMLGLDMEQGAVDPRHPMAVAVVACTGCGHVMSFKARTLGLH